MSPIFTIIIYKKEENERDKSPDVILLKVIRKDSIFLPEEFFYQKN